MFSRRRTAQLGLGVTLVLFVSSIGVLLASQRTASYTPGPRAPDFTLQDLSGKSHQLEAYRGQAVVLIFASVNCPVSNDYRYRMGRFADQFVGKDVRVFSVNSFVPASDTTTIGQISAQKRAARQDYPTLLDPTGEVARAYGVTVTPTVVLVGHKGLIRYQGAFDDNQNEAQVRHRYCEDAVRSVLAGQPPRIAFTQAFGCLLQPR
jgi:peroxiredoxin